MSSYWFRQIDRSADFRLGAQFELPKQIPIMSSSVLIYFEDSGLLPYPPDPAIPDSNSDFGQVVARLGSRLDSLARTLSIRPISDFLYADPEMLAQIASELDGQRRKNVEHQIAIQRRWHATADGLATVEILLSHLSELDDARAVDLHSDLLVGGTLEPVLADLRALARALASRDARFHLEVL